MSHSDEHICSSYGWRIVFANGVSYNAEYTTSIIEAVNNACLNVNLTSWEIVSAIKWDNRKVNTNELP